MEIKNAFLILLGVALAAAAVAYEHERLAPLLRPANLPASARQAWREAWPAEPHDLSREASGLRKCLAAGQVNYTNGACPAGSQEQAVAGGTVTVVPGFRSAQSGSAPARGHVRDLLLDRQAADVKAQRIDEVIGK